MVGVPPPPEKVLEELKEKEEGEFVIRKANEVDVSRAVGGRGGITTLLATEGVQAFSSDVRP